MLLLTFKKKTYICHSRHTQGIKIIAEIVVNMNIVVRNNIVVNLKILLPKSATILIQIVRHKQEKRYRMINLLQENKQMKSQRTSIHICNSHEPTHKPKIAKEYVFSQRTLRNLILKNVRKLS